MLLYRLIGFLSHLTMLAVSKEYQSVKICVSRLGSTFFVVLG